MRTLREEGGHSLNKLRLIALLIPEEADEAEAYRALNAAGINLPISVYHVIVLLHFEDYILKTWRKEDSGKQLTRRVIPPEQRVPHRRYR